ncbi:EFR1 family ferrodoxin [Clostridium lundense]|uniref:EFR1 family ferrodoxin n=1 Tax=Clostridium lundense TaxID=319475 RepID=UPI000487A55F|nr:EFR1 family ferrodoxin [Clostridium lundense]
MRGILYYFSGTGNTKWIGDRFKESFSRRKIEVDLANIESIEEFEIDNYDFMILGTPIYAELEPKIVDDFIEKLPVNKNNMKVIIYSTQAAKTASAVSILKLRLEKKGYKIMSESMFQMSNNYYFGVGKKTEKHTFNVIKENAIKQVNGVVKSFINNKNTRVHLNYFRIAGAKISSKIYRKLLPKMSKNFTSTEECIKCGLCLRNCPKGNITFENSVAVFHSKCMLCMRCIHICPVNAIRYKGKMIEQTQNGMIKNLILK